MDDANKPSPNNNQPRIPLGMSAFGPAEREQFGQSVRLAMACIESPPEPTKGPALPQDESAIRQRLKALSQEITSNHADLLELLVRFDDVQGWKSSGARHCAAWMNIEIGISIQLSWEYLRVGRKLQTLPTVQALFRVGKLAWSKVRLITRVANTDNEKTLCHAALDASVSEVKRLCEAYQWSEDDNGEGETTRVIQQWASRALTWSEASNGSTRIQLVLPPEVAQAFLNSVEQSLNQLGTVADATQSTVAQRRADAAVLMAETSLQHAGRAIATADRYQVSISVDADELATDDVSIQEVATTQPPAHSAATHSGPTHFDTKCPAKRPTLNGVGPIAKETARRVACDCSLSVNTTSKTELISIGRKSRIWPSAMARAIKERDQHCAWPGCTHSHQLHIHHIKHWADGGETSVNNGVCLCSYHHTMVHEGGYRIEVVEPNSHQHNEQFIRQQYNEDVTLFDFEKSLRNDKASFNTVRNLSPTRFRYQILDSHGRIVSGRTVGDPQQATEVEVHQQTQKPALRPAHYYGGSASSDVADTKCAESVSNLESTRVDRNDIMHPDLNHYSNMRCREAVPESNYYDKTYNRRTKKHVHAFTYETAAHYGANPS